jgi:diguanylate cyclase (GGDEF)-like protein
VRLPVWLGRQPPVVVLALGLALVAGLGYLAHLSGGAFSPLLLDLVPVSLAAWYGRRPVGVAVALAGGLALAWGQWAPARSHSLSSDWGVVGEAAALVVLALALAGLRQSQDRERELARTDRLTGVANGRAFYELAAFELTRARRYHHPFSVAYLDIDDFQMVNDALGHSAGDALLRTIATALQLALRHSDIIARVGGDEFIVLLPETPSAPARLVIGKLQQVLASVVAPHGLPLQASFGVATYLIPPESVDALVHGSDALMHAVKKRGKNGVEHTTFN